MDKFCICIAYNGKWTPDNKYLDHETKLILVNDEITFEGLVEKISQVLKLKRDEIESNIWFDTKLETSKGMLVTNDEEVTTCIFLLKNDSNFKTSRLIVDIAEKNTKPAKRSKRNLGNSVVPQEEEEGQWEMDIEKDETAKVDDKAIIVAEPKMEPEYPTTEEESEETGHAANGKNVRRSARLSKKRKRLTIPSKKRKKLTSRKDDLPAGPLREDASLDEIVVGSVFEDKRSLKKCLLNNAIKCQFKFKVIKSSSRKYYLKCYDDKCSWALHSVKVGDSEFFKVSRFENKHSCSFDLLSDQRHITARVISDYIIELVRDTKAEIKPSFVVEEIKKRHGLDINYHKAWRATQLALGVLGIPEQNHIIEESNPETCTDIKSNDLPTVVLREDASLEEVVKGSIFEDKESLKKCFLLNAIKHHFKFKVTKSSQRKYSLKCCDDECGWKMNSAQVYESSFFRINKFEKAHSCAPDVSSDQKHATYKVISDYIIELLHDTGEEITPKFVVEEMKRRYGLTISYHKAWRAIQLALGVTRESPELIEEPELCPTCLHLTDGNVETFTDDERDDQTNATPIGNLKTSTDVQREDKTNSNPIGNLEICTDVERDDQTNPHPIGNLKTWTDAEMDDLINLTPTENLDTCTDAERDDQNNPIPIDNLEICTDVQMDDQGNPNPIGNLETCRDFERNGQTSPKPIGSLGTCTDFERNDQSNPNPIGNFEICANIEMDDQTNPTPTENLDTCTDVERDDQTNPIPIDNLEICTDVQMDDQGNPNPIGNLETCRDFERNGQTSPKPIGSLGTCTDFERNDQSNPNPIGVERDDHTNPKPTV